MCFSRTYFVIQLHTVAVCKDGRGVFFSSSARSSELLVHTTLWKPRVPEIDEMKKGYLSKEDD